MIIASVIANIKYFFGHEFSFYLARPFKKYYIIRRSELGAGFFSNYYWVMGHVIFAKKLGYIPVVDMKNYPTLYSEDTPLDGIDNAWNYYFENVGDVSLEEAYASGKYVLGEIRNLHKYTDRDVDSVYRFPSKKAVSFYNAVVTKNIRIRADILDRFEDYYKRNVANWRTIGVHIRGTDMKNDLGHPMPANTAKYIEAISKLVESDGAIQKIYLATDEKTVVDSVSDAVSAFSNTKIQLVYQDAFRSDIQTASRQTGIHEQHIENPRERHKYLMGLEVLQDAWMLSRCDYLICGYSNITNTVLIWNDNKFIDVCLIR